jgi:5-methylcytosine-specific restriction enzyme subunit McrC
MHPTLILTERTTTRCRLAPAVVAHLLARHRTHLTILPTGRRHHYRITPLGRVGTIDAPGLRLVLRPKIPLRNVFYLLDPSAPLPDATGCEPEGAEVLGFLGGRLAEQMTARSRAGLQRGYSERRFQGTYLLGRPDVAAQMRDNRREQLHSRYEEFGADVPCNQAALAAARALLDCPHLPDLVRPALLQAMAGFPGVTVVPLDLGLVEQAESARPAEDYRPLLETCRVLAESLVRGEAPAFLLDLERLFERHVTRGVVSAFGESGAWVVRPQQSYPLQEGNNEMPGLLMRPDLTVESDGRPVLVLDTKWKRLTRDALVTSDVYQVVAYGTALGAGRGVLVYPGRGERCWEYVVGRVRLAVRTLDVAREAERCLRGLRRLGRWVRREARAGS